ncbi:hypothetical protein B1750_gp145 [Noumeavirus]|uniref:Uncharacterized protein n=1 Tax=Marseillevirus sp. TaxID=2809551 RepID=A0AA96EQD2_9VIRU|nr:hypothetical protein B1750_gp145 [Noumeavirus]AQM73126.1 hypothetical protein NMV_145 [Noumeavirus]WNL50426.1 hypothetical protein MarDSR_387 [Marseillevirus sp.]
MSKLAECLACDDDVFENIEEAEEVTRKKTLDDEYLKIFEIEKRLRNTCEEMFYPQILSKQKVGLFMFLSEYKK